MARSRRPRPTSASGSTSRRLLHELERADLLVRGELRPGGTEREWCDPDVLRRLRRASLAALRREVEPAEQAALGRFLPAWHGIGRRATLREALVPLQGLALPVSLWETEVLPRRVPGYQPSWLDGLCAAGELVWVGAGLDRVAVYFREDAPVLGRPAGAPPPETAEADAIRAALGRGAMFWADLLDETALEAEAALPALWELVWAGEVTNDAWTPLRAGRRYEAPRAQRRPRRFSRTRGAAITSTQGRWSPTDRLFPGSPDRRALAELLLERQGIVTRDGVRGEGIPGGYSAVYSELKDLETIGACRRGYFVEGLGGAQFALAGAVERLRELRAEEEPEPLVLAAADPAQPYGAALPWPKRAGARAARVAGAQVVLLGGEAALFVERGGRTLVPLREPDEDWLRPAIAALVEHVRARRRQAARRGALRRPAGDRDRRDAAARRGRLPRRPSPRCAPALAARGRRSAPRSSATASPSLAGGPAAVGRTAHDDDELLGQILSCEVGLERRARCRVARAQAEQIGVRAQRGRDRCVERRVGAEIDREPAVRLEQDGQREQAQLVALPGCAGEDGGAAHGGTAVSQERPEPLEHDLAEQVLLGDAFGSVPPSGRRRVAEPAPRSPRPRSRRRRA